MAKKNRFIGAIIFVVSVFFCSCQTLNNDQTENLDFSSNKNNVNRLQVLLKVKFNEQDFSILNSIDLITNTYKDLDDKNYSEVRRKSKLILFANDLPIEIYKSAYKAFTISMLFSSDMRYQLKISKNKYLDYYSFQEEQCKELCDSVGWKVLANDNSYIFTPEGYNEFILSETYMHPENNGFYLKFISSNIKNTVEETPVVTDCSNSCMSLNALKLFLNADFNSSIQSFLRLLSDSKTDEVSKSMYYYWIGRSYFAQKDFKLAKKYFLLSGSENPLGLYDALSGQMLKNSSGLASTLELSPFTTSLEETEKRWIKYPQTLPNSEIATALKAAIIIISQIKIKYNLDGIEDIQQYFSTHKTTETILLEEQLSWLKRKWLKEYIDWPKFNSPEIIGSNIAWLLYASGDNLSSMMFVSNIRDSLDSYSEINDFLYFLFYPRMYEKSVYSACLGNGVDPDLVFAIIRQEGIYNKLEERNSLVNKSNYLKKLLIKYSHNIVKTLTAYSAGEEKADEWLEQNIIHDDVIYLEFIKDNHIKDFVKNALRNYYNIKWIYFNRQNNQAYYRLLFDAEK